MGSHPLRILVIDRERTIAETLAMVLRTGGFEALAVFSGEQALAAVAQRAFDVLLTDVVMESTNGVEIALAVLALQPSIRVILFSGSDGASPILREAAQAGHHFPVLAKPLHPVELLSRLQNEARLLDEARAAAEQALPNETLLKFEAREAPIADEGPFEDKA